MRLLVAGMMIVVALSGCASTPSFGLEAEAPEWAPGHSWTYTWRAESEGSSEGAGGNQWFESTDPVVMTVMRNATIWQETGWLVAVDGALEPYGDDQQAQFVDPETLLADEVRTLTRSECDEVCTRHVVPDGMIETRGIVSGAWLQFPMTVGDTWTYTEYGDAYDAEMMGGARVSVEAGDFQAMLIRYSFTDDDTSEEREWMNEIGATVHKLERTVTVTRDVHYVPAVENVVLDVMAATVTFDRDITWPDGDRETEAGQYTYSLHRELIAYDLAETEPFTDQQILEILDLDDDYAPTPYGYGPIVPEDLTITIDVPDEVNLRDADSATLSIAADGDNGPYTHQWTLYENVGYYWDDGVVEDGSTVTLSADAVAMQGYVVRTYDANGTYVHVASGGVPFIMEDTVEGTCEPTINAASYGGDCTTVAIATTGMDTRWDVTASLDGELRGNGVLRVIEPRGWVAAERSMSNGEARLQFDDWGSSGEWLIQIDAPDGLQEMATTISYRVEPNEEFHAYYY